MTSLISFENKTQKHSWNHLPYIWKPLLEVLIATPEERKCTRHNRDLKNIYNHATWQTSCTCALLTTILECMFTAISKQKTFSCLHPEEIRNSKGKVHTFQTGTTGVVWSNSNGYGMVCYGDIWWVERGGELGVRMMWVGSLLPLSSLPLSPLWGSVGRLTPLRTLPLPSPLLSSPGCTWRETKRGTLGHLIDCDISNWSCGSSVNDREWICIHNVQ